MSILQVFKSTSLFHGWTDGDLHKLMQIATQKILSPGEYLFFEGDESVSFFVVATGTIALSKSDRSGDGQVITSVGTHSHLGDMAMLIPPTSKMENRSASAEASEPTTVLEIPYRGFEKIIEESPRLGMIFYRNLAITLASRIRRTTEDLTGLRALRLRHV